MFPSLSATFSTLRKVPFIVYLWIAQLFLLVNASSIAPSEQVDMLRTTLVIYMLAQLMFFGVAKKVPGLHMNLNAAIPWFIAGFVATVFVITGFQFVQGLQVQTYAVSAAVYLIIMHAVVVAVAEEFVFRGTLPAIITPIPAQILFGVFHVSAYGGNILSVITAIIAGFVFYGIMKYTNIWATMGIHAGFNIAVLKIFGVL